MQQPAVRHEHRGAYVSIPGAIRGVGCRIMEVEKEVVVGELRGTVLGAVSPAGPAHLITPAL